MKNNNAFVVSLMVAGLIAGGSGVKLFKNKRDNLAEIRKLQQKNDSLIAQKKQSMERRDSCVFFVNEDAKANPSCDNMKKLLDLIYVLDTKIWQKYAVLEQNFIKKCKNEVYHNLGQKKSYYIPGTGRNITPYFVEDWMKIIYANSKKIPHFDSLNKEHKNIMELRKFIYNFEWFVGGEFAVYVFDIEEYSRKSSQIVKTGKLLDDNICQYNNDDNIRQNKIIKDLFQQYLDKFIEYNENNMPVLDKNLYDEIYNLAFGIVEHNNLEAGVISYNKAIEDINKQISYNQSVIKNLQHKTY